MSAIVSHYNADIAPTKIAQRTWGTWNVAALWVGMAICVPTYTLGWRINRLLWSFSQ